MKKSTLLFPLMALFLAIGCKKEEDDTTTQPPNPTANNGKISILIEGEGNYEFSGNQIRSEATGFSCTSDGSTFEYDDSKGFEVEFERFGDDDSQFYLLLVTNDMLTNETGDAWFWREDDPCSSRDHSFKFDFYHENDDHAYISFDHEDVEFSNFEADHQSKRISFTILATLNSINDVNENRSFVLTAENN